MNNLNNDNVKEHNLEFKEHREFFGDYYESKKRYNAIVNRASLDLSLTNEAFSALFEFVGSCISQIEEDINITEINDKKQELIKLIQNKQHLKALDIMNIFFVKVCKVTKDLEIEPKPERKVTTKDYDLIQHAMDYAVKMCVGDTSK